MALKFQVGDPVRQIVPIIQGTVIKAQVNGSNVEYLVEHGEGEDLHRQWFKEENLEVPA